MPHSLSLGNVILRSGHNPAEDPISIKEFLGDGAFADVRVRGRIIEDDVFFGPFSAFQGGMIVGVMLRAVAVAVVVAVQLIREVGIGGFELEKSPRWTIAKKNGAAEERIGHTKSKRDSQEKREEKSHV